MPVHSPLIERLLVVVPVAAVTGSEDHSHGVQIDLIGRGRQVVLRLRVVLGCGHDRLAALLESLDRTSQGLELAQPRPPEPVGVQYQHLDPIVFGRQLDRFEERPQEGLRLLLAQQRQNRTLVRIVGELLDEVAVGSDDQRRRLRNLGRIVLKPPNDDEDDQRQEQEIDGPAPGLIQSLPEETRKIYNSFPQIAHTRLLPPPGGAFWHGAASLHLSVRELSPPGWFPSGVGPPHPLEWPPILPFRVVRILAAHPTVVLAGSGEKRRGRILISNDSRGGG